MSFMGLFGTLGQRPMRLEHGMTSLFVNASRRPIVLVIGDEDNGDDGDVEDNVDNNNDDSHEGTASDPNNNNNDFISIALFHVKNAQLR